MKANGFDKVIWFLQSLEKQAIDYTLAHHRDEAVMVIANAEFAVANILKN